MRSKTRWLTVLLLVAVLGSAMAAATAVYITPKGKSYHLQACRTLKRSKEVVPVPLAEARKRGLRPCKVCKPPR